MFVSLHGDFAHKRRHLLHYGRGQRDVTCQKKGNLHSQKRQNHKCHQQIIVWSSSDGRVSTAPGDGKAGISGSLKYTRLSPRELSVTKTIECSLGPAKLCWCACQVNELSWHLPGLTRQTFPVLYRPPHEHRLVKHSALLGCSDNWVTDSQRLEGTRHPHIHGQYLALRHKPRGLHPQTSTLWKPPISQCNLKRISGAEWTEWWPPDMFT
jgi:hypothetical protein